MLCGRTGSRPAGAARRLSPGRGRRPVRVSFTCSTTEIGSALDRGGQHKITKSILASAAAIVIAISVGGCSTAMVQTAYGPMPQYCTQNNTATGAIIGGLLGAGVGAAIGG